VGSFSDFDRDVAENGIPEEELREALARWLGEQMESFTSPL
jgi:hypothetical protein